MSPLRFKLAAWKSGPAGLRVFFVLLLVPVALTLARWHSGRLLFVGLESAGAGKRAPP
jgi:hypothetical protein